MRWRDRDLLITSHPQSITDVDLSLSQYSPSPSPSRTVSVRARVPRRRTQSVLVGEGLTEAAPVTERSLRSRSRARIPRRRVNPNRDLERNERNTAAVAVSEEPVLARSRSRSRSRSRHVSVPSEGRSELRGRSEVTPRLRGDSERSIVASSSTRYTPGPQTSRPKVIFPRKNLFPKLKKKFFLGDNEVDTGSGYRSVNKDRLRSSLYREVRTQLLFN